VAEALAALDGTLPADAVGVAEIDPELADTAAFCERYGVSPDVSANCVVITGRREGQVRYAACVVLATTRADVNGVARRELDVRKASFAPVDEASPPPAWVRRDHADRAARRLARPGGRPCRRGVAGGSGQRRPAFRPLPGSLLGRPALRSGLALGRARPCGGLATSAGTGRPASRPPTLRPAGR
jgi:hypothetical protein